jgi:hypothetical protein
MARSGPLTSGPFPPAFRGKGEDEAGAYLGWERLRSA